MLKQKRCGPRTSALGLPRLLMQLIAVALLVAHSPLASVAGAAAGPPADNDGSGSGTGGSDAAASAGGAGAEGGGPRQPRRPAQQRVRLGLEPPNHIVFPGDPHEYWPYGVERWGQPIRPLAVCMTAVCMQPHFYPSFFPSLSPVSLRPAAATHSQLLL
jgi:hypothetical protein